MWLVGCVFRFIGAVFSNNVRIFSDFRYDIHNWSQNNKKAIAEISEAFVESFNVFPKMINWLAGEK